MKNYYKSDSCLVERRKKVLKDVAVNIGVAMVRKKKIFLSAAKCRFHLKSIRKLCYKKI